jgi:hypothetical protein
MESLKAATLSAVEQLGNACLSSSRSSIVEREDLYYQELLRFFLRIHILGFAVSHELLGKRNPVTTLLQRIRAGISPSGPKQEYRLWKELDKTFHSLSGRTRFFPGGGILFKKTSLSKMSSLRCPDRDLIQILQRVFSPFPYSALPPESLGFLYETLLSYVPCLSRKGRKNQTAFFLESSRVLQRRWGAYYTPRALVEELVRTALRPVARERLRAAGLPLKKGTGRGKSLMNYATLSPKRRKEAERALLGLKVVDPACGGAAMLMCAHDYLSLELSCLRNPDRDRRLGPDPQALRDVLKECIHGVDRDPLAVELAGVSLWLNAKDRNLPQGALEKNLCCGNALVGVPFRTAHPETQKTGWPLTVPDAAFSPVEGDGREAAAYVRRRNREEAEALVHSAGTASLPPSELACDCWTAAFFWPLLPGKTGPPPLTTRLFRTLLSGPAKDLPAPALSEVERLKGRFGFFHWKRAFPQVFSRPEKGFDCVLANPPWERIKVQEKEFFARHAPAITRAGSASKRRALIADLKNKNPKLFAAFQSHLRRSALFSKFLRGSGRYLLAPRGDPNLYLFFTLLCRDLLAHKGRAGLIVPSGIASDQGSGPFFRDLMEKRSLVSLFDFVNTRRLFPGVASPNRFCLMTLAGPGQKVSKAAFQFYSQSLGDLKQRDRRFTLNRADLNLFNPITGTCPPFLSKKEADMAKRIYGRTPLLAGRSASSSKGWGARPWCMFHMSGHSMLFRTKEQLEQRGFILDRQGCFRRGRKKYLRLYESKLMHQLNHRYNTFEGVDPKKREGIKPRALPVAVQKARDPGYVVLPRYWVPEAAVVEAASRQGWDRRWFLALRSVTNVTTNRRSAVAAVLPWSGVGNSASLIQTPLPAKAIGLLAACLSSFAFDSAVRMKLHGPNLNFFIMNQLPVPHPAVYDRPFLDRRLGDFIWERSLELIYTARDLVDFARDAGFSQPPFPWDEERRSILRAELDAVFFLLYGFSYQEAENVLDTFPILARKEQDQYGEFRTRRLTLAALKSYKKEWREP